MRPRSNALVPLRAGDRILLNPWVSRAGNAAFLTGAALFVVRLVSGCDPLLLVAVVLLAAGVLLIAPQYLGRWRDRRLPLQRVQAAFPPSEFEMISLFVEIADDEDSGWRTRVTLRDARITNRARDAGLSLSFRLSFRSKTKELKERILLPDPGEGVPSPLNVAPTTSEKGDIVFSTETKAGVRPDEEIDFDARLHKLHVEDHVSGKTISFLVPGRYEIASENSGGSREQLAHTLSAMLRRGYEQRSKARTAGERNEVDEACRAFMDWSQAVDEVLLAGAPEYYADLQGTRAPWALQGKDEVLVNMDARLNAHSEIVKKLRGD